jgi:type III pantothenate kinase
MLPRLSAICIDDGNTRCKVGIFRMGKLKQIHILPKRSRKALFGIPEIKQATWPLIWSSVSGKDPLFESLASDFSLIYRASPKLSLPFKNLVKAPGLGPDRLCAAIAARAMFPDNPALAIDAGTCLKFDFVSADAVYHGGSISPGLQMRFDAMHRGTGKLPLLIPGKTAPTLNGKNTEEAMRSGAQLGMAIEIEGRIEHYLKQYPDLKVVITGGDIKHLPMSAKNNIFAEPNLVLNGLFILLSQQPNIKALMHS